HGVLKADVAADDTSITINGKKIAVTAERDPAKLPWKAMNIDVAMECTGIFTKRDKAALHLEAGAKRVLVSAPADGADLTVVYGVNHQKLSKEHLVVSNGSCTTNCLAPMAQVLHQTCGIKHGFMTTIHAYTGDQNTVDTLHKDLRRARAAALSMIPTSTGAAKTIGLILPELKGKLDGVSVRVPVPNVSLIDLTFQASRDTSKEEINQTLQKAAAGPLKGILGVSAEPLVSIDYTHTTLSSIADLTGTFVTGSRLCRVAAWYDNEWAFSCRMLDVAKLWAV
ncbi:MAG: aldehyde dehydrogenase, partial [Pseudomonadota bacterium]|nr:aldehyde dehydrogenase [Pseudomonadota bacterium]